MKHNVLKNYGTYILLKDKYSQLMYIYEFLIGRLLKKCNENVRYDSRKSKCSCSFRIRRNISIAEATKLI